MPKRKGKHPGGRPPAGLKPGERVSGYAQLTIRLPQDAHLQLRAVATVKRVPSWRIVHDALQDYLRALPDAERRRVAAMRRELADRN
jgi:predicted transcriptional regulator